ncbi:hypothetical protein JCM10207_004797 [Rhodosporidiobolus poonsookiae]
MQSTDPPTPSTPPFAPSSSTASSSRPSSLPSTVTPPTEHEDQLEDIALDTAPPTLPSDDHPLPPLPSSPPLFPPPPSQSPLPPPAPDASAFLTAPDTAHAPSMQRTASGSSSGGGAGFALNAQVWGVALVGFDHAIGPNVEFAYPRWLKDNDELSRNLPFLALPDGAHARDEDYSYFHLLLPSVSANVPQTIFGISCNRQIPADELLNKGKDVTRSTVQKAIVVLANKPIFGPLRDKLGVITRSFFAQRDFDDKSILVDLYQSFEPASAATSSSGSGSGSASPEEEKEREREEVRRRAEKGKGKERAEEGAEEEEMDEEEGEDTDGGMYMGTSLRELVYRFRFKTLMLLKLLMLQRRVMFFGTQTPVEQLCTFQYSLVALIPALLTNLSDAASPTLDTRARRIAKPTSLKTSDRRSLIRYLGLPLDVFGKDSFFQPYLPLQQIDLLKTRSFLVGTTNSIFQQQRDCAIDVLVNIDTATVEILNPKLTPLVTLTAADRKWMDTLVTLVDSSWNAADPTRPLGQGFVGSDDFLRAKFEEYVCSLLACVKFGEFLGRERGERAEMLLSAPELESYNPSSFNEAFINAFKRTKAYELWDRNTDEVIFDLVEPKHPMEGKTNPIEDVGIRLVHGLHDHLPPQLQLAHLNLAQLQQLPANLQGLNLNSLAAGMGKPARERLSRGLSVGGEWFAGAAGALRGGAAGGGTGATTPTSERDERGSISGAAAGEAPASPGAGVGTTFLAGVDVAKTGAAQLATGIGSFLGSARKGGFFSRPGAADESAPGLKPLETAGAATVSPALTAAAATRSPALGGAAGSTSPALKPLETAGAATVPSASSSAAGSSRDRTASAPSLASTGANAAAAGFGSFFGGLKRSLAPADGGSAPASPRTSGLQPSPAAGGGGGATSLFSGWGSPRSTSPAAPPSASALPAKGRDVDVSGLRIRDLDAEVEVRPRDLDREFREREEAERERERARRKLEGGAA